MKLIVAGKDRTSDLKGWLSSSPARAPLRPPAFLSPQHSALALRNARSAAEYQDILLGLIRIRRGIATSDFDMPRKPGPAGWVMARVRAFLWKLLRYQHDRMAFQQNVLNELLLSALEFERDQRLRDSEALKRRVEGLENRKGGAS